MELFLAIAYWFVLLTLIGGAIGGLAVGGYYLLRERADKRPDLFFSALLICLSLTLVHNLLFHTKIYTAHPEWLFLPLYFTLAFGPLWFFFVKMKLFPHYKFRWTDTKHLALPIFQFLYFIVMFFNPEKEAIGRQFWSPFFGAMEMLLYIGSFFSSLYFGYRYLRFKRAKTHREVKSFERTQVAWIQRMSKVLFILFFFNASYIFTDFLSFELFGINLHLVKGFTYIGSLSFSSILAWLAFNGLVMRKL